MPLKAPERILIVSTTGLGDSLWATPALRAVRERYPESYVALLTSQTGYQVLKNLSFFDEAFILKNSSIFSFLRLFLRMKKLKFDTVLIFHASQRFVLPFCALLGPHRLIGTEGLNKGLDHLLTDRIEKKPCHEIARRLEMVACLGAKPSRSLLELAISKDDHIHVDEFINTLNLPPYIPLVCLHPGAKDHFKQWDPVCFIEVGRRLQDHLGCQIFITGNASEKKLVEKIAQNIPGAIPVCGHFTVHQTASLIQRMSLMITNDTGPMHLAFAVRTPTVALFSATDPKLCGPYMDVKAKVIYKKRTCQPCLMKKCREPFCLLQISPSEVVESALKLFYDKEKYEQSFDASYLHC